jgi:predicted nucleotide-binding protein (sugar kinase/HSP70/actin superfamily)
MPKTKKQSFEKRLLKTLKNKKKNASMKDVKKILDRVLRSVGDPKSNFS